MLVYSGPVNTYENQDWRLNTIWLVYSEIDRPVRGFHSFNHDNARDASTTEISKVSTARFLLLICINHTVTDQRFLRRIEREGHESLVEKVSISLSLARWNFNPSLTHCWAALNNAVEVWLKVGFQAIGSNFRAGEGSMYVC